MNDFKMLSMILINDKNSRKRFGLSVCGYVDALALSELNLPLKKMNSNQKSFYNLWRISLLKSKIKRKGIPLYFYSLYDSLESMYTKMQCAQSDFTAAAVAISWLLQLFVWSNNFSSKCIRWSLIAKLSQ